MARRRAISAAIFLSLLIVPILQAAACASARACGVAPCCVSARGCPMHKSSSGSCRLRSCDDHGVSLVETPPAVSAPATAIVATQTFIVVAPALDTATTNAPAPPDPPPPRRA